jgi:hypothetical protein
VLRHRVGQLLHRQGIHWLLLLLRLLLLSSGLGRFAVLLRGGGGR